MHNKALVNSFEKLIQISHRSHFLNFAIPEGSGSIPSLQYGHLGSLLKKNIFSEWLNSLMYNSDINVVPIEVTNPRIHTFRLSDRSSIVTIPDVISKYFDMVSSLGLTTPFGFAVYGSCMNQSISKKRKGIDLNHNTLNNLQSWTRLSLIFFCPTKKSMSWFYHWSKQRYLWWRKFSSIPSMFSMSEVTKSPSEDQHLSLLLEFPWGKEQIETITLYDSKFMEDFCQRHLSKYCENSCSVPIPAVVTCEIELDLGVIAYLANSFAEKWREGEAKNVFHLHYKLAPYKVCLYLEAENVETRMNLKNVARHLTKELKDNFIDVFPMFEFDHPLFVTSQFQRFDEMGIPYVVVLNENSLSTGIAGLRSRDTTLQEQIHITEITVKLLMYLKMK